MTSRVLYVNVSVLDHRIRDSVLRGPEVLHRHGRVRYQPQTHAEHTKCPVLVHPESEYRHNNRMKYSTIQI